MRGKGNWKWRGHWNDSTERCSELERGQEEWTGGEYKLTTSPERHRAGCVLSSPSILNKCLCHTGERELRLRVHSEIPENSEMRWPSGNLWPEPEIPSRAAEQGLTQQSSQAKVS